MMQNQGKTTALPGIFATVAAGFDLTAKHLWLLLLPIALDTFYWLGPRLRIGALVQEAVATLPAEMAPTELITSLAEVVAGANLFTTLTVQFIGVPALMTGFAPERLPVAADEMAVGSWGEALVLFLLFTLLGLLFTAVYYTTVAYAVQRQSDRSAWVDQWRWVQRIGSNWVGLLGLAAVFIISSLLIYLPLSFLSGLLFLVSPSLGSIVLFAGPVFIVWLVIFMSLAPAGIALNGRSVRRALVESVRIVQMNLWPTLFLILGIFLIATLLDWILLAADSGTWLTFVNILAHAFVSTALVAALFIFYRDRYKLVYEKRKPAELEPTS